MSMNANRELIMKAQSILNMVGHIAEAGQRIVLSGRQPTLSETSSRDVMSSHVYDQLEAELRDRVSAVVQSRLSSLRDRFIRGFWKTAEQHHSLSGYGVSDEEIETRLIQLYENKYRDCLEDIRQLLQKSWSARSRKYEDRNPRGGFGDVSTLLSLQLTNPA